MNSAEGPGPDRTVVGVSMILAAVFLMTLADALVKFVSAEFTLWQVYTARGLVAIPILAVAMRWRGVALRPKAPAWVYLRALLLVLMWIAYYGSLPVLSLSVAAVALYTAPLLIAVLAALLLGNRIGPRRWFAVIIGFVGVLAILRPGTDAFSWFTLLPLLGAAFYALAMILTRSKCVDEDPLALALALNLSLMVAGLVASVALAVLRLTDEQASVYPFILGQWSGMGLREWAIMALLGILIAVYSACVARAYQVASPTIVATFDYAYLVFAALWGFVIFSEVPDMATAVGMILIAGAGLLVTLPFRERRPAISPTAVPERETGNPQ